MLAVQLQQELTEVQQFAEAEKNNFAQAGNRRGEAAMLLGTQLRRWLFRTLSRSFIFVMHMI
ncbi:unnamed protein product [Durusdinium trenchii]|uniref:Uncharacterized protein n=1 Tax=Durusdinium trenchii TaxID=1381693 RepID=A0ABP0SU59_9DINO